MSRNTGKEGGYWALTSRTPNLRYLGRCVGVREAGSSLVWLLTW